MREVKLPIPLDPSTLAKIGDQTILTTPFGTGTMIRLGQICPDDSCRCSDEETACPRDTLAIQVLLDGGATVWMPIDQVSFNED